MYAASFMFTPNNTDGDFRALDNEIMQFTESIEGYLGKKKWVSPDQTRINVVYYFNTKEALHTLRTNPTHRIAKQRNAEWYDDYEVEIYEVLSSYKGRK
jgi:heme-degrading monooxygenase HmoA